MSVLPAPVAQLIQTLQLHPHPEGGYYRETWRSPLTLPPAILPADYQGERAAGTAILFLLPTGQCSRWHRVRSTELWFHQAGDPLELSIAADLADPTQTLYLGCDHCWQGIVPPHWWQKAQPQAGPIGYALVSCVVVPGFDFADFEMSDA